MSEDKFENKVKNLLHDYAPEVPAGVYAAMRRKLWWSNFTKLSLARFNMYYLLLLLAAGTTAVMVLNQEQTASTTGESLNKAIPSFKSFEQICIKTDESKEAASQEGTVDNANACVTQAVQESATVHHKSMVLSETKSKSGYSAMPATQVEMPSSAPAMPDTPEIVTNNVADDAKAADEATPTSTEQAQPKNQRNLELPIPVDPNKSNTTKQKKN